MRLVPDNDPSLVLVRSYQPGEVQAAGQVLRAPCLISASGVLADWPATTPEALDATLLEAVVGLKPTVLVIGSAHAGRPALAVRRQLEARGIAVECMDLGGACRTYNVLASEYRPAVAALFP